MSGKRDLVYAAIEHRPGCAVPYDIALTVEYMKEKSGWLIDKYGTQKILDDLGSGKITRLQALSLSIGNHLVFINPPWWEWGTLEREFTQPDTPKSYPKAKGYGSYNDFFKNAEYLRSNYDVYVLAAIWGSHFEKAHFCRGIENFLYDIAADPVWSETLLNQIIARNLVMLENILDCESIDGILLGSDWGTQNDLIISPDTWRQMIAPGEQREYDMIHSAGKHVWIHSCGKVDKIIGDLVQMGIDVLNPVQPECMDISKLKQEYGGRLTFYGGISTQKTLPYGTPDEVRIETLRTISEMSKNGGYITSPAQGIQTDVPDENLQALIEAAKKMAE